MPSFSAPQIKPGSRIFAACCALAMLVSARAAERVVLEVAEDAGTTRVRSHVTTGLPFPMGQLRSTNHVRLLDEQSTEMPLQVQATATWRDGSIKWLLLDFPCDVGANLTRHVTLEYGQDVQRRAFPSPLKTEDAPDALWIDTGTLRFSISKKEFAIADQARIDLNGDGALSADENLMAAGLHQLVQLTNGLTLRVQAPESVQVEENGPWRAVAKISGWLDDGGTNRLAQYITRVHTHAHSSQITVFHTLIQLSAQPMLWVADYSLTCAPNLNGPLSYIAGNQPSLLEGQLQAGETLQLLQLGEGASQFVVGKRKESGFKSPGWLDLASSRGGVRIVNRHFWQQNPKLLSLANPAASEAKAPLLRIGLYPRESGRPLDMDQGLAKTHELLFDFHAGPLEPAMAENHMADFDRPLMAIAPVSWYCGSQAFGPLHPFDFDRFPDYETLTEASGDQFIRRMATGWRHWGDYYYGGEYKGTNSYMNLEYDVHHNFYCQFARTGLRKYLDAAAIMARHQADIDTNHKTGWQWKHSPRHVETRAEFGHTFTRGLLESWFFTGNRRCLEAAIELGDYFSQAIRNPRELGNERQIGWSLISLLPVYEATWDQKYLAAARDTVERLMGGLDEKGKFSIRWDNRISFFNGIAATGFIYYYRATGDERVAQAILKVMRRTRGFYPEYAGRTLEAIAWAYDRTREPEYLDLLQRTWESTLSRQITWNVMELGAPTIFTVHALPFIAQSGLIPATPNPLKLTPAEFASESGMRVRHIPNGEADLYLQAPSGKLFDLIVVRKGAWKAPGVATLFNPAGKALATLDFPQENSIWQRRVIHVPATLAGTYRLALQSISPENVKGGSFITWDIATSIDVPSVFSTPEFKGLQFVTPRLFTRPRGDANKIELELMGEGEGFKKAVIYDPEGKVAGSAEAFIDLGDKGRYYYKASATIPPSQMNGIWSISLQEVTMTKLSGLSPYFSTSKDSFFSPDSARP